MSERVFEAAGVWASGGDKKRWVEIHEADGGVQITIHDLNGDALLRPCEARVLAEQLTRAADRQEGATGD